MRGYNAALSDMLEDFNAEYNDLLKIGYIRFILKLKIMERAQKIDLFKQFAWL